MQYRSKRFIPSPKQIVKIAKRCCASSIRYRVGCKSVREVKVVFQMEIEVQMFVWGRYKSGRLLATKS